MKENIREICSSCCFALISIEVFQSDWIPFSSVLRNAFKQLSGVIFGIVFFFQRFLDSWDRDKFCVWRPEGVRLRIFGPQVNLAAPELTDAIRALAADIAELLEHGTDFPTRIPTEEPSNAPSEQCLFLTLKCGGKRPSAAFGGLVFA